MVILTDKLNGREIIRYIIQAMEINDRPNTGLVRYSNGLLVSLSEMVQISNGI
jgi:hypothetical protein